MDSNLSGFNKSERGILNILGGNARIFARSLGNLVCYRSPRATYSNTTLSKATSGTPFHLTHYGDVNESGSVYSSHTCERERARGCVIKRASVAVVSAGA